MTTDVDNLTDSWPSSVLEELLSGLNCSAPYDDDLLLLASNMSAMGIEDMRCGTQGSGGGLGGAEGSPGGGMADPRAEYFRDMSRWWMKRVLYPLIMCVGVLGNGVTIVILTRRRMRSSTNHYLTALASSDLLYLVFAFTLTLDHYGALRTRTYYTYWQCALMLTDGCSNTSVWLTLAFTIERYVAVCHPIRGKVLCTRSRAKRVVLAVVSLCFLVVLPTPFEWTVVEVEVTSDTGEERTIVRTEPSALGNNETYRRLYYWFTSTMFVFLPLVLLAIFNSFLIRSVHHSKTRRRKMTMRRKIRRPPDGNATMTAAANGHHARKNSSMDQPPSRQAINQENRITIMLISVVIMFLICQLPTAVTLVYTSVHRAPPGSTEDAILLGLGNIFNCLVAVNAACNFILYCAFSDRFRRTFLRTFLPFIHPHSSSSPAHSQAPPTTHCYSYTHVEMVDVSSAGGLRRHAHNHQGVKVVASNGRGSEGERPLSNGSAVVTPSKLLVPADTEHKRACSSPSWPPSDGSDTTQEETMFANDGNSDDEDNNGGGRQCLAVTVQNGNGSAKTAAVIKPPAGEAVMVMVNVEHVISITTPEGSTKGQLL